MDFKLLYVCAELKQTVYLVPLSASYPSFAVRTTLKRILYYGYWSENLWLPLTIEHCT